MQLGPLKITVTTQDGFSKIIDSVSANQLQFQLNGKGRYIINVVDYSSPQCLFVDTAIVVAKNTLRGNKMPMSGNQILFMQPELSVLLIR